MGANADRKEHAIDLIRSELESEILTSSPQERARCFSSSSYISTSFAVAAHTCVRAVNKEQILMTDLATAAHHHTGCCSRE